MEVFRRSNFGEEMLDREREVAGHRQAAVEEDEGEVTKARGEEQWWPVRCGGGVAVGSGGGTNEFERKDTGWRRMLLSGSREKEESRMGKSGMRKRWPSA